MEDYDKVRSDGMYIYLLQHADPGRGEQYTGFDLTPYLPR